jgi:hypothetical protein
MVVRRSLNSGSVHVANATVARRRIGDLGGSIVEVSSSPPPPPPPPSNIRRFLFNVGL